MSTTTVETSSGDTLVRDKAVRLFTYLKELTELRSDVRRNCDEYDQVVWWAEIPREKECYCAAWDLGRDAAYDDWLRVERPRRRRPPTPPPVLAPWLSERDIADASQDAPQLKGSIVEELGSTDAATGESETAVRRLEDCPTVKRQWELYVENHWLPWAIEERRLQPVQSIYNEIFAAYQNQERMGEAYEVVVGVGLLTWHPPHGPEIKRHIAVAQAAIEFDSKTGVITVGLPADGARLTLEQEMLEPQDRPLPDFQNRIQQELSEISDGMWAGPGLATALNAYFQQLSSESSLDAALEPQDGTTDRTRPRMHLAPALLVRQRSDRNLVRIFADIAEQLNQGGSIPVGVEKLVSIRDDQQSSDGSGGESENGSGRGPEDELYFPLPANEAQRQIAQRLAGRQGVLVQGPPGTGKSHTIANLICHLLATGKRLLVTSHTARALRVLKKYFPPEFSPLCVSLLGDDTTALRELEDSVQGILSELNQWDSTKKQARIRQLLADVDRSRRDLAEGYSNLKTIRTGETETVNLNFGEYCATPQGLAVRLAADASRFSWIGLDIDPAEEPPLTNSEATSLLKFWRALGDDPVEDFRRVLPELTAIPDPVSFDQIALKERELSARMQAAGSGFGPLLQALASAPIETRRALESALRDYVTLQDKLACESEDWVKTAVQEATRGKHHSWQNLAAATTAKLEVLEDQVDRAAQLKVSGIEQRNRAEVRAHVETLRDHLLAGKSTGLSLRYNPFAPKHLKASLYLVDEVRVNGRPCERYEEAAALLQYLDVIEAIEYVDEQWSPYLSPSAFPMLLRFGDQVRRAELLKNVLNLKTKVDAVMTVAAGVSEVQSLAFHDRQAIASVLNVISAANVQDELRIIQAEISRLIEELRSLRRDPNANPLSLEMLAAVEARDLDRYSRTHNAITSAWETRSCQQRRKALENQLGRPELVASVQASRDDSAWDERMADFVGAWNWSRACRWLMQHADPHLESSIRQQIDLSQQRIRQGLRELGACKAWEFVLSRLKPEQREHLMAWRLAVKKIGKGTGKYASQYRKEARYHLDYCRGAIPAWVMPIYRVAETTKPAPNLFDVAIIDEASQSGPEALFLQYIARKIVVVGDDQQISPESVGLDRSAVDALRQRYIRDLPHWDAMGVDNSFFDQAQIRFAGRIRLREHFRCMPEIIQFSNNLCYQAEPLVPLRQYGSQRLTPVLTRHVPDGYAKGSGDRVVNQPEADAIVDQISKCLADPAYDGKSFGVICLQGNAQANLIRDLLMDRIGAQKMQLRGLVCGNAYAFQGDERDVIFLSMVAATNDGRRVGVLSKESDKRRFNVGASRARDQMWLFHSAAIDDLSSLCLRRQLLEYCLNPKVQTKVVEGIDVVKLRQQALETRRSDSRAPLPFDSWFEIDVFLQIIDRGFRVIPQYELAGKRIDLLIEGMRGRLAVECDGDQWHGLEEWDRDVDRQRMLERCGLQFWRVRGSAYYRDPAAALQLLWRVLEEQGILSGYQGNAEPSATASKPSPVSVIETDLEEESDNDERPRDRSEQDIDSGLVELADGEEQAPLFSATPMDAPLILAPYSPWTLRPVPDPHSASLSELIDVLIEIVAAEGPVVCRRAYSLYNKAAGNSRLGRQIVQVMNRAIYRAVKLGRLAQNDEQKRGGQINQVVRIAGSPEVNVRDRGPRPLEEIPPLEIAAVREKLLQDASGLDEEQLVRQLAAVYGIVRKTAQVRKMLLG
jgi:very-short-patch-repair endonuclease